jgi:hypothetical protein
MEEAKFYKLLLTQKVDHIELSVVPIGGLQPGGVQRYCDFDAVLERLRQLKLPEITAEKIEEIRLDLAVRKRHLLYREGLRLALLEVRQLLSP